MNLSKRSLDSPRDLSVEERRELEALRTENVALRAVKEDDKKGTGE